MGLVQGLRALALGAALAAGGAQAQNVVRYASSAEPRTLDSIVNWLSVTHQHSYLVYDNLYTLDSNFRPQPQMIESAVKGADGTSWTLTLRPGQTFHDGAPVTSADVIASIGESVGAFLQSVVARNPSPPEKSVAFTIGMIALGAKMAKADGRVTQSEIRAFREVFHIPKDELANVAHVFNLARRSTAGFEVYAGQIARIFRHDPAVLEEVLDALFHIAKADGGVLASELSYLEEVARIFRLSDKRFEQIHSAQLDDDDMDPFAILGVRRDIDDAALKRHWRKLAREHHPDALVAHGMPADFVALGFVDPTPSSSEEGA